MNYSATLGQAVAPWSGVERRRVGVGVGADADTIPGTELKQVGRTIFRYGLAAIFLWIGLLKFTAYEAKNIEPLVMHSPIFSWLVPMLGLQGLSNLIGVIEISIGALIATRAFWPRASAIGSLGAVLTFVITLSFLLTTPGVWEPGYGFGFLSGMPGQFLAKDLVLLGVSIWCAGEAWRAACMDTVDRAPR